MHAVDPGFSQTIPTHPAGISARRQIAVALLALACVAATPLALKTKVIVVLTMAAVYVVYNLCIRCLKGKEPVKAEICLAVPSQIEAENKLGIKETLDAVCSKENAMGLLLNALREYKFSQVRQLEDCFAGVDVINKELGEDRPHSIYGVDNKGQFFAVISAMLAGSQCCPMLFRYSSEQGKYEMYFMSDVRSEVFTNPQTAHAAIIKLIQGTKTS